jgi:HD superfamily phosphohydrolase
MNKRYEIRDPVYGFIDFNEWEKEIINHSLFQRLRRIRQLGLTDMVYPGATHTRFEHSLGVMHLATLMYDAIVSNRNNQKLLKERLSYNAKELEKDKQLLRLAALLHDTGHAPFSHASEEVMPVNERNEIYKHEDYSCEIIKGPLRNTIENHQINNKYRISADEIVALIEGDPAILQRRLFWKVLISSQLDADRGDYLLRDSIHAGVKYGIYDHMRLLNTLALGIEPESDDILLGVGYDGLHIAESIVIARYLMFTQVYFHKTRRAYDYHLKESMKTILNGERLPLPSQIDEYYHWDDFKVMQMIKNHQDNPDCKAILDRNHIRMVHETLETPSEKDEEVKERNKEKLEKDGIWYFEDSADNVWYKSDPKDERKEIMIVLEKRKEVRPLSEFSKIVKNMGEIKQIRLYVKPEDQKMAERMCKR